MFKLFSENTIKKDTHREQALSNQVDRLEYQLARTNR
ncbi:MAG: hypothetical protein ACI9S6_003335, partial [Reinekea sp.]